MSANEKDTSLKNSESTPSYGDEKAAGEVNFINVDAVSSEELHFLKTILDKPEVIDSARDAREIELMIQGIQSLTEEQATEISTRVIKNHEYDRNFPEDLRHLMKQLLDEKADLDLLVTREFALKACTAVVYFNSPYPEVRAVADPWDDDLPCETLRMYIIAMIWVAVGTFMNQFFETRYPSVSISAVLLQMFIIPCGYLSAYILPDWGFTLWGTRYTLNPGPWSYKEQAAATVMFSATSALPYVDSQILVQKMDVFYGQKWATLGYQILMMLSTQFLGFGIAGLGRSLLVYPTQNLFMVTFPNLAMNRSFLTPDSAEPVNGWRMKRSVFFGIFFMGIFIYQWVPSYLAQFLSTFNWMTWIAPNNFNLAAITGTADGLGLNPISTFDWTVLNFAMPLVTPCFSFANMLVGSVVAAVIITPAIYYSNMLNTGYLPINTNHLYDNTGAQYNVTQILTNGELDIEKYQAYSPPYYAAANLVVYGTFFAMYPSVFITALLYDWRVMWAALKEIPYSLFGGGKKVADYDDDVHCRMMAKYDEVPQWWFFAVLLISLGLAIATVKGYPTRAPVWGIFMALGLSFIFLIPIGMLYSQTNQLFSINVLTELIIGYAAPRPVAMMLIKAYGVNTNLQAIYYIADLKLSLYAKVPFRTSFRIQMIGSLISIIVTIATVNFQMADIEGLCTSALLKTSRFICPSENTYFSASVMWGAIGPKRMFNGTYPILKWTFLIGCFIPVPLYLVRTFFPKSQKYLRYVDPNVMGMGVLSFLAPYNLGYIIPAFYLNIAFLHYIRKKYPAWFLKYNYILMAALTAGAALSIIVIFFSVQYHPKDLEWWGNTVMYNGVDGNGMARLEIPSKGYFGSDPGTYYV